MLALIGCGGADELKTLEASVNQCVGKQSEKCSRLRNRLNMLHSLMVSLQSSPQGFGLSVMRLQGEIVSAKTKLRGLKATSVKDDNRKQLLKKIRALEMIYQSHLTVIRWLEAPNA